MSRKQIDELQARVRQLERVNEAILAANETLKTAGSEGYWKDRVKAAEVDRDAAKDRTAEIKARMSEMEQELGFYQRRQNTSAHTLRLEAENNRLRGEVVALKARLSLSEGYRSLGIGAAHFGNEVWRRLVQLCHPDKHNGSKASTEATRWLMENRP